MSRRPVLIPMLSLCLALAGGGAAAGNASAQAMRPAAPPAGSAAPAPPAVAPAAPASSAAAPSLPAPAGATPAPARGAGPVLDPQADRGRNDVLGRLLPKAPTIAGTDKVFPKADLAAPLNDCPATRPAACSLDYVPVCAAVSTGTDDAAAVTRKTFGSACKACRAPNVTGYATGECPAP